MLELVRPVVRQTGSPRQVTHSGGEQSSSGSNAELTHNPETPWPSLMLSTVSNDSQRVFVFILVIWGAGSLKERIITIYNF